MLPIRNKTIFKSRWWALAWAGGILWSAVDFAGTPSSHKPATAGNSATSDDGDAAGAPTADDIAGAKAAINALD
ncbi:hypothetical protein [Sphingomonas abietis]|uniref:Uncharacterized protein n=1 Tax=Sphingomonas abietis TaxID=3012344 RepID=A0ABY7NQ83_9SPHN|nr:hypothetical protein [Sphingomonas abietis]WBO23678.1 hypothetical protein PBT88_06030 [Sphingomonas abietis]